MKRKACERRGHEWVAWSPGGDPFCARWFCNAQRQAPVMALIGKYVREAEGRL